MFRLSRVTRAILGLLICISAAHGRSSSVDDLREMIARAEALYYQADFAKSVELLARADELLQKETGQLQEKTQVKLHLALAFIGLNERNRAKGYLSELYALDPDRQIDAQMFSPKVIQLAEEAKTEDHARRCSALSDQVQQQLEAGNGEAAVELIKSGQPKCSNLSELYIRVGELYFRQGLAAYKTGALQESLHKFKAALAAEPEHELAMQYIDLTQSRLEVAADRALVAWRKDFIEGDFVRAARDYHELLLRSSLDTIQEVHAEYRRVLSTFVDAWNRACAVNDAATMEEIRLRVNELLPESSFAEDLLAKMNICTSAGCIQMTAPLALSRLRNRVDPHFSPLLVSQLKGAPSTVLIKARVNEKGDVTATQAQGGNPLLHPAIRAAIEQWKFLPAVSQGLPQCMVAEIPIVINFTAR